ncbi:MAG: polysaccharide lyase [Ferruginibacter sp.]
MNCSILKTAKVTLFLFVVASLNACTKQIKLENSTSSAELTSTPALVLKGPITSERAGWKEKKHPHWIFSDDFETTDPLVGNGRYFEYDDNGGDFIPMDGVGVNGSRGMRVKWQAGEVPAGGLTLGFGKQTDPYMDKGIRSTENFREIYYRMYLKMQAGWIGNPAKLSRATILAKNDWSQAMIAHLWQGNGDALGMDPVSGTNSSGAVVTNGYNDFANFKWLGFKSGTTPIFNTSNAGKWYCIESHVKLNDKGKSNGIQEFWIDGHLEARSDNLNFVDSYSAYGINVIFFENYWNDGSPQDQERYFDNIVVSTKPIGF